MVKKYNNIDYFNQHNVLFCGNNYIAVFYVGIILSSFYVGPENTAGTHHLILLMLLGAMTPYRTMLMFCFIKTFGKHYGFTAQGSTPPPSSSFINRGLTNFCIFGTFKIASVHDYVRPSQNTFRHYFFPIFCTKLWHNKVQKLTRTDF